MHEWSCPWLDVTASIFTPKFLAQQLFVLSDVQSAKIGDFLICQLFNLDP